MRKVKEDIQILQQRIILTLNKINFLMIKRLTLSANNT
jgi:hypothetical protein